MPAKVNLERDREADTLFTEYDELLRINKLALVDLMQLCSFSLELLDRDPAQVERQNLVNLCKLIVKELIDSSVQYGRQLDSDFLPLQHFFIVLEHALRHGLRPKKGLLGPKKELWDLLQLIEKYNQDAHDITTSVRDLPTVKTSLGRARAWIRLALMQKKLADYLKVLFDQRENGILLEFYEPGALLLSDESVVLLGLLLGLNVVDCNLCLKVSLFLSKITLTMNFFLERSIQQI